MVSDEDRESALHVIAKAIYGPAYGKASKEKSARVLDDLVSHGWGPKPAMSARELTDLVAIARNSESLSAACWKLEDYLRERGIEVADDDQ
jgi:hypothetical protein